MRDEYGVTPRFVHTDKDMAEIGASHQVWPKAKHQLCWWHQREAIRRRLKGHLPTSAYNAQHANHEHPFIDISFKPISRVDPNDTEGGVPGEIREQAIQGGNANTTAPISEDPNSIKIRIPISQLVRSGPTVPTVGADVGESTLDVTTSSAMRTRDNIGEQTLACSQYSTSGTSVSSAINAGDSMLAHGRHDSIEVGAFSTLDARESAGGPTLASGHPKSFEGLAHSANSTKLTIRIPAPSTIRGSGQVAEDELNANEETANGRRTFCPLEHRDAVVEMMERHFCAHPLIPGYSAPTPEGIKAWAVKQTYEFCVLHDLANLWAYLWENWYRRGRWELWARSGNPREIPRLKTTMFVEGQ